VLQCVAVCCSVPSSLEVFLPMCVAECCSVLQCALILGSLRLDVCCVLQCVAFCCSVLQCALICGGVLPDVCCSVLQCVAVPRSSGKCRISRFTLHVEKCMCVCVSYRT